jgi:hypothetical protein
MRVRLLDLHPVIEWCRPEPKRSRLVRLGWPLGMRPLSRYEATLWREAQQIRVRPTHDRPLRRGPESGPDDVTSKPGRSGTSRRNNAHAGPILLKKPEYLLDPISSVPQVRFPDADVGGSSSTPDSTETVPNRSAASIEDVVAFRQICNDFRLATFFNRIGRNQSPSMFITI